MCYIAGRVDIKEIGNIRCEEAGSDPETCQYFFVSTPFSTAQLCEWHVKCVSGSVMDCAQPPPPMPPPHPAPPTPSFVSLTALAAQGFRANTSLPARLQVVNTVATGTLVKIAETGSASIHAVRSSIDPALEIGAERFARRTGLDVGLAKLILLPIMFTCVALLIYYCIYEPGRSFVEMRRYRHQHTKLPDLDVDEVIQAAREKSRREEEERPGPEDRPEV